MGSSTTRSRGTSVSFALALGLVAAVTGSPVLAAGPSVAWTRQFGSNDDDTAYGVAVDRAGRSYVAGGADAALPGMTIKGPTDAFLRKLRPNGKAMWTRQFGSSDEDQALAVAATGAGPIYVGGYTDGTLPKQSHKGSTDAFLRKYRPGGKVVWTRQFGSGGAEFITAIAIDRNGRIYVAGYTDGTLPNQSSTGSNDAFVRKYLPNGKAAWTRQFGTGGHDFANGVAVDRGGRVYVVGLTDGTLPGMTSQGGRDAFVRKYRPNGSIIWTRQFGSGANDVAYDVTVDRKGRVYIAGFTLGAFPGQVSRGAWDAFVRRYGPAGKAIWTRQFGTGADDQLFAITSDSTGRVYAAGSTFGTLPGMTNKGGYDAFVRSYRPNGASVWLRQFGSGGADEIHGAAADPARRLVLAGVTEGALPGKTNKGGADAFVRQYR